ncbi:mycothiol system anti-sigma-R factor [Streptomyces sp. NPDC006784]|uniref:mycothiol system anti-sigma-R factor n=1 Tax=Streptomyces sp. NPDC006784 TaxID=3364764 RepID=UPI0036B3090E
MSCGEPHETDCSEVLDHLYEYLDREMPEGDCAKFQEHFDECSPCFEKYGLEREVKKLVKRCCGQDDVPSDLRSKVMGRIEVIRQGEAREGADAGSGQEAAPRPASGGAAAETADAVGSRDDKNPG